MINTIRFWRRALSAMLILGGLIVGRSAFAISVGGSSGYPNFVTGQFCFFPFGAQIQYNGGCGSTQIWTIPLPANAGSHPVTISATNNSSLNCFLCSADQNGNAISCPSPSFPAGTSVQSATVSVPSNGGMYLMCIMGANSVINTVNYNQ